MIVVFWIMTSVCSDVHRPSTSCADLITFVVFWVMARVRS